MKGPVLLQLALGVQQLLASYFAGVSGSLGLIVPELDTPVPWTAGAARPGIT